MNPFLKKEIRLLLPKFVIGCLLLLSAQLIDARLIFGEDFSLQLFVICPALGVMLALESFGAEISAGTFAMMLAQPVARQKIWDEKIRLLAVAMAILTVFWILENQVVSEQQHFKNPSGLADLFCVATLFSLVVFSGGMWTVLLLRQVAAAFWFTLLVPGALLTVLAACFEEHGDNLFEGVVVTVLGLYSLAGFFFARWLFFRAQDLQWSGGNIEMPELRRANAAAADRREWRPRAALWRKEILLHQSQLVMAFVLAVLHGGVLVARQFVNPHKSPELDFVLHIFWGLWLVMPLLVGCAAVAEERKLGTLEGQLCLPVQRREQFEVKFVTSIGLALLLGLVMPLVFEGTRILPSVHFETGSARTEWANHLALGQSLLWNGVLMFNWMLPLLSLGFIVLLTAVVSFFASSLARNTLQALAPAVLGIVLAWGVLVFCLIQIGYGSGWLWRGPLAFLTILPMMAAALTIQAGGNFREVRVNARRIGKNAFVLAAALATSVAVTSAVYHRVWEKLSPLEPAHGAARLQRDGATGFISQLNYNELYVRLPGGAVKMAAYLPNQMDNPLDRLLANYKINTGAWQSLNGSGWREVRRASHGDVAGIKDDGTLWVSRDFSRNFTFDSGAWKKNYAARHDLVQFGTETNWRSMGNFGASLFLTKTDGTLWIWGTRTNNGYGSNYKNWPGLQKFTPKRLGTESDWAGLNHWGWRSIFQKTDGSAWMLKDGNHEAGELLEVEPDFILRHEHSLDGMQNTDLARIYSSGNEYTVGIGKDGTFQIYTRQQWRMDKQTRQYLEFWSPVNVSIGPGKDWLGVAGYGRRLVTLKADGTLWLWDFYSPQLSWNDYGSPLTPEDIQKTVPRQLGKNSDWIAIASDWRNVIALAADGSVWFWPLFEEGDYSSSEPWHNLPPLLDISRKPQLLGNVLSADVVGH